MEHPSAHFVLTSVENLNQLGLHSRFPTTIDPSKIKIPVTIISNFIKTDGNKTITRMCPPGFWQQPTT
jgi:hypothetical protein